MAMQKCHIIKDPHNKQITSICYNPLKHEIAAGLEDGTIKTWDCVGENIGKLTKTCHEHDGWVNCLLYWPDAKLLLSAANDGKLIAWGSSMLPMSVSKIGTPIYCMAWNIRRSQIILGVNSALKVYTLKDPSIIVLHPYRLDFTLEIWVEWDGSGIYETYGQIYLNIGNFNHNIDMWHVPSSNYIRVPNQVSYFASHSHTFQESEVFAYLGNITAHGDVWEFDSGDDDHIATPDGDVFQMKEILNQNITRHYPGSGSYIEISLKVTKLY
ncbi:uncharacterized WD repeat-containing protein all2124-like isoform X2 [Clytia hemisphaerica]|uniref:Uncharacterized protein n=1 Tax=Clytia hemisphaerica TaxID=252671 RepID=A0A7M5VEW1_9CNID